MALKETVTSYARVVTSIFLPFLLLPPLSTPPSLSAILSRLPQLLTMPKKRRNGGRNRHGRGITRLVDCSHCMCKPAKDKAIGRFAVRNMVDTGALNDLKAACVYEGELD